jgi:hypothetical protein
MVDEKSKQELIDRIRQASLDAAKDKTKDKYSGRGKGKTWYGYYMRKLK